MNLFSPLSLALITIVGLSLIGLPVAYAMIGGSILWLFVSGLDMGTAAEQLLNGMMASQLLLAIPLFILAASFMSTGAILERLLDFCNAIVGRFRGGLAQVNVLQAIVLASMSGSALADAAASGKLMQTMMTRDGKYPPAFAAALTCVSSVIGPIIPPSIPLVLFALISDTSVGYLFLGGVIPGLLLGAVQSGLIAFVARRRNFPVEKPVPLRELPRVARLALPALMMPVILLGCMWTGVTTPTEAAAVAAAYALLVSAFLYRSLRAKDVYEALVSSARVTVSIGMLIAGAMVFNFVITSENIPKTLSAMLKAYQLSPLMFLLLVNILLLILGCFLEGTTIILVILPRADSYRPGARHRHGAFRRGVRRQHHDRAGHASVRTAALHDDEDRPGSAARHGARSGTVPLCDDRRARGDDARSQHGAVPPEAARLHGVMHECAGGRWPRDPS